MKKSTVALLCSTMLLLGTLLGFLLSPIKKGLYIGNNSGNNNNGKNPLDDGLEVDYDDEDDMPF